MELSMNRFLSNRPFALLLAAVGVLALSAPAPAAERAYASRGTAHFVNANDFVGAGTATHLGLYEEEGNAVFSETDDPTVREVKATATYTAANGDKLFAEFVGELDLLTGVITATVTYVGGTGQFAHATGAATLSAQLGADGIDVAVRGTIDY
jgi:hypothetical protein